MPILRNRDTAVKRAFGVHAIGYSSWNSRQYNSIVKSLSLEKDNSIIVFSMGNDYTPSYERSTVKTNLFIKNDVLAFNSLIVKNQEGSVSLVKNSLSPKEHSSEKSFGIVFSILFLILGVFPFIFGSDWRLWSLLVSCVLIIVTFFRPKFLSIPSKLWLKTGSVLGAVISPVVMSLIYFLVFTPIGLFMRLRGIDILKKKLDKNADSYWEPRKAPVGPMKHQF